MASCDGIRPFESSAALALLDELIDRPAAKTMPAASVAWDSAWIACLTNCPVWAATAERDFDRAVAELTAVLWPAREVTAFQRQARHTGLWMPPAHFTPPGFSAIAADSELTTSL